jgi:hypothetical protein
MSKVALDPEAVFKEKRSILELFCSWSTPKSAVHHMSTTTKGKGHGGEGLYWLGTFISVC